MTEEDRQACHADLAALRADPLTSERMFRLLEKLVARLDRLETRGAGSLQRWSNEGVLKALEEGRKKEEDE